jgi:hypothetical protein
MFVATRFICLKMSIMLLLLLRVICWDCRFTITSMKFNYLDFAFWAGGFPSSLCTLHVFSLNSGSNKSRANAKQHMQVAFLLFYLRLILLYPEIAQKLSTDSESVILPSLRQTRNWTRRPTPIRTSFSVGPAKTHAESNQRRTASLRDSPTGWTTTGEVYFSDTAARSTREHSTRWETYATYGARVEVRPTDECSCPDWRAPTQRCRCQQEM